MKNTILCITHSQDYYTIDNVITCLRDLGYTPQRVNIDSFPDNLPMSLELNETQKTVELCVENNIVNAQNVAGIWLRKNSDPLQNARQNQDPLIANQCFQESRATKNLILNQFNDIPWIDPLNAINLAEDKGLQLVEAKKSGLKIPNTLISNNPDALEQFYNNNQQKIVAKMIKPLTISMDRPGAFVYTSRVNAAHLANVDTLRQCPMIFQEEVDKAYELRIAYVDGACYCGKIVEKTSLEKTPSNVTHSETTRNIVDWRYGSTADFYWENHTLPDAIQKKLSAFMKTLQLSFGAIDMIVNPKGDYIFLEVNPCGEWGMLEQQLNLPISQAIANALHNKIQRHEHGK